MTVIDLSSERRDLERFLGDEFISCTEQELKAFFIQHIKRAFKENGIREHYEERIYLSNLLFSFSKISQDTKEAQYVIDTIVQTSNFTDNPQIQKRNADALLFFSGIFPENLIKSGVSLDFYVKQAGAMYVSYGISLNQNSLRALFLNLGQNAPKFYECLKTAGKGFKTCKNDMN